LGFGTRNGEPAYRPKFRGGPGRNDTRIEFAARSIDSLNANHPRNAFAPGFITRHTCGIRLYDSVVVFESSTMPI